MAGFVLQKGADYICHFGEHKSSLMGDDSGHVADLEAEYYILRTALVRIYSVVVGGVVQRGLN